MSIKMTVKVESHHIVWDDVCSVLNKVRFSVPKCMSVNAMNLLNYKCQIVNQASFLEREPTNVFLHGCHTIVYIPVLVNVSCTFILDGFDCLDAGMLMRVPHDGAILHA